LPIPTVATASTVRIIIHMLYLCYLLMTETNLAMYPFKVFSLSHFFDRTIVSPWLISLQRFEKEKLIYTMGVPKWSPRFS
jgi:hypothetical protein